MSVTPEVLVHVLGSRHDAKGRRLSPEITNFANNFFIPRNQSGLNVLIFEDFSGTIPRRDEFLSSQSEHSFFESNFRGIFWDKKDQVSPEIFDEMVKNIALRHIGAQDYYSQRLMMLDELRELADFQAEGEAYSEQDAELNSAHSKGILEKSNIAIVALRFGEKKLGTKKHYEALSQEAELTRKRHPTILARAESYVDQAQRAHLPLRIIVNFGSGHVQGLAKGFEELLGTRVSSSYVDNDFLSHHYDLIFRMETDPTYVPADREILNALLETVFTESGNCEYHPLRRMPQNELGNMLYPLLRDSSEAEINRLLKTVETTGYEEALTQLTGVGEHIEAPGLRWRISTWPIRRMNKLLVLKK